MHPQYEFAYDVNRDCNPCTQDRMSRYLHMLLRTYMSFSGYPRSSCVTVTVLGKLEIRVQAYGTKIVHG
jgi:hypothetical protein